MKQLSGVDAAFLYMETGRSFGHVAGVGVFQRPEDPDWSPYDAITRQIVTHLEELEPLRRRLVEVPFGLDHPYWVEDPDFDLEFHIRARPSRRRAPTPSWPRSSPASSPAPSTVRTHCGSATSSRAWLATASPS